MRRFVRNTLPAWLTAFLLVACGGGGGGGSDSDSSSSTADGISSSTQSNNPTDLSSIAGAPASTGNTATDGFNWFNFRRQQAGLLPVTRNAQIDAAALGHSEYQRLNNEITHEQTRGRPGFTGVELGDRLAAANYALSERGGYAYGEVISSTPDASGFAAAEDLIAAIYHRFVILEPMFKEAGAGAATVGGGNTYFTTNFSANGLDRELGNGQIAVYPFADQQRVPRNFMSDNEAPDPVPDRNEVGYPISVHADILRTVTVDSFTVRPRGGSPLAVRPLISGADVHTPDSAAAIVPLEPLAAGTTYDVQFTGAVNGAAVSRSWSFTTN